ncbi:hypothetical protein D3C74_212630 [compost metagenome]
MSIVNSFYKKNLQFLKSNYPNIYEFSKRQTVDFSKFTITTAQNGEKNIIVNDGSLNYSIHSKYNPSNEAKIWVDSIEDQVVNVQNVLIFGFGLGYHIDKFIEKYPDKTLYIYEPDEKLFTTALESRDLIHVLGHSKVGIFAVGSEEFIRYELINNIAFQVKDSFSFVVVPIYNKMYFETIAELQENTETLILNYRSNFATVLHFQYEWIENILYNFNKVLTTPSLNGLKGACSNIPAIIVGSGPSLKEDIEYLRKLKSRVLIIAAGSSIQALLHEGIQPDCIVSIDGGEPNYQVFKDIDVSSIPFIFGTTIKHTILEREHNKLIHLLLDLDLISLHLMQDFDEPVFQTNSTVTGTCIQLANYLDCSQVILMGQDLSYPDGQYYTAGVKHVDNNAMDNVIKSATEEVDNVNGGKNKTTKKMLNTLRDIEHLIALIPDREFVNTSKMGANIRGAKFINIEDIYKENYQRDLDDGWFEKLTKTKLTPYTTEERQKLFRKLKVTKTEIRKIENKLMPLINKLKELHEIVQTSKSNTKVEKKLIEIDKSWNWISSRKVFEDVYFFPLQAHISLFMRQLPDIIVEKDLIRKSEAIVTHLGGLVIEMVRITPYLNKGFEEAIRRINERNMSPNIKE